MPVQFLVVIFSTKIKYVVYKERRQENNNENKMTENLAVDFTVKNLKCELWITKFEEKANSKRLKGRFHIVQI